ncbi:MAG: ABC transporter ATP-binding protein [Bacteroidetes bacterium]|nr:ABC transporter ATP-binding protein [Bacteroidota bacterium]
MYPHFYNTIVKPAYRILTSEEKRRGAQILILMALNAILDFFSVATLLPVIFLLVKPDILQSNPFVYKLYTGTGFSTPSHFIIASALAVVLFSWIKNILSLLIAKHKANYCFTLGSDLSIRMLSHFMNRPYSDYVHHDHSREINRIANSPVAFANNIILPLLNLLSEGLVLITLLLFILFYQPGVVLLLSVILIPLLFYYQWKRKATNQISNELKERYPLTLKYALQMVEGFVEVKSSGKESFFIERFKKASKLLAATFVRDHVNQTRSLRITEVVGALAICTLIIFSILTQQNDQQTILLLGVYAGVSFRLIPSVNRILNSTTQIRSHEFLFQELSAFAENNSARNTPSTVTLSFTKSIELRDVSFGYTKEQSIFQHLSLVINKGDKIALTGKSGAGKTSLLMILLRFLNINSGKLLVDNQEITASESDWRRFFGYVSQSPFILDSTIAENIAFGIPVQEIDHQKINQLVRDLDLQAMVDGMPDGINTNIGEKGIKLSGGQRQRIAVARALYHNAEVLLFDEITNQLDAATEQEILATLQKVAWSEKTIVMITHHPHLLSYFDRVLSLENGVLTEKAHP